MKVLIVENDSALLTMFKDFLCGMGLNVDTSSSARQALNKLRDRSYDIVISDMGLDDNYLSGDDVLKKAKAKGAFTVLCSGASAFITKNGYDYVLPKPFHFNELQECINLAKTKLFTTKVHAKYMVRVR